MFYGGGRDDGGNKGDRNRNRNDRYEQMTKQQQLIEMKKQEIQRRLEEEKHKKTMETLLMGTKTTSALGSSSSSATSSPATTASRQKSSRSIKFEEDTKSNSFVNDGSFLEKFKFLQDEKIKKEKEDKLIKEEVNEYGFLTPNKPPFPPSLKILDPNSVTNLNTNNSPKILQISNTSVGNYNNCSSTMAFPPPKFYGAAPPPPPPPPREKLSPPVHKSYTGFNYQNAPPPPPPPPPPVSQFSNNSASSSQCQQPLKLAQSVRQSGFPSEKVKQLAADVAEGGDEVEEKARKLNKGDPIFWFLYRPDSAEYGRYRDLVTHLKIENMPDPPNPPSLPFLPRDFSMNQYGAHFLAPPPPPPSLYQQTIKRPAPAPQEEDDASKKRRSRWGPQSGAAVPPPTVAAISPLHNIGIDTLTPPPPPMLPVGYPIGGIKQEFSHGPPPMNFGVGGCVQSPPPGVLGNKFAPNVNINVKGSPPLLSKVTRTNPQLLSYAKQSYGTIDLDEEQWKQCEEAYKMNLLFQDIARKKAKDEQAALAGKFKHEYDSDEEVDDGGTWEHKQRMKEMEKTRDWAQELTQKAKGKHHIGDFLPPEELDKFMDKYKAVKEGRQMDESAYQDFKIAQDNVGFKLLQKMGWNDGQGLGSTGQGITAPIDKAPSMSDKQGLGVEKPSELREEDDEYAAYRKRMMLAYRFRPNPLNNPRRAYY